MLLQPRPAPSICSPSLLGRSLRPLRESVLLKKLQVKADPDLPGRDLVHQECMGCGAFAFLSVGIFATGTSVQWELLPWRMWKVLCPLNWTYLRSPVKKTLSNSVDLLTIT